MKQLPFFILLSAAFAFTSTACTGWNIPQPIQSKPWTYLKGDQFGRDQIANRTLVAYTKKLTLRGKEPNEILTLLGQPQEIRVIERNVSEDWYFIYYKRYAAYVEKLPYPGKYNEGEFVVRFQNDRVTEVVNLR